MGALNSLSLPFTTLPDPVTTGEGILDPLGLARTGEALADWLVPGMTARMSRPRFLTAIAVASSVCQGLEDRLAKDGVSPAYLVFEWLLVEGLARAGERDEVAGTPGIDRARMALSKGAPLSAAGYLKVPTVFGFHGVYKRLAVATGIVDDDLRLADKGYRLLKLWEEEQGVSGFSDALRSSRGECGLLRAAVEESLANGYTSRSGGWQGWGVFARHLAPAEPGSAEVALLQELILDSRGGTRGELYSLLERRQVSGENDAEDEAGIAQRLLPGCSSELRLKLEAVGGFEAFCATIEHCFDLLRHLSTRLGARALERSTYSSNPDICATAALVAERLAHAERTLESAPAKANAEFSSLVQAFKDVKTPAELCIAALQRHAEVQRAKPPEGKREWFEHGNDGAVFVRVPYRLDERPELNAGWNRPYRLYAMKSFCSDLRL